eukprot:SAG31_NODE_5902_length_2264_cov_2.222633_1_plen_50_part_10
MGWGCRPVGYCSQTLVRGVRRNPIKVDTFSISALHLAIKVPYFSDSGHKN